MRPSSGSRDMLVDRQTDGRVDHNTPHPYRGGIINAFGDSVPYSMLR